MIDLKRITVLDIDGTVSAHWGRQKLLPPKPWGDHLTRADFEEYHKRAVSDPVINSAIPLAQDTEAHVIFNTTRPESYRVATARWLYENMQVAVVDDSLLMRANNDDTPSHIQKSGALAARFKQLTAGGLGLDTPVDVYDDDIMCLGAQHAALINQCDMSHVNTYRAIREHGHVSFMLMNFGGKAS